MAKKNADLLKFTLNADEEKLFTDYIERNKFKTPRSALVHLLTEAAKKEGIEVKNVDLGTAAEKDTMPKEVEGGKKGRGRPKKAQEGEMKVIPDSDSENDDMAGAGVDGQRLKTTKTQTKKAPPRTKKQEAAEPVGMDETFEVKEQAKTEAAKKTGKGKKPLVEEVEVKNKADDQDADAVAVDTMQSPKMKTTAGETKGKSPTKKADAGDTKSPKTKADGGDVPEVKKRRGGKAAAAATADDNDQEPVVAPVSSRGKGMKKTTSVSAVSDAMHELAVEQDEPAASGDGKGRGGKRKKANEKKEDGAATSASQPEPGATSGKPKRGRGVPKKDYTEKMDDNSD